MECLLHDLRAFRINAYQWTAVAQDEREWRKTEEQGASVSWRNRSLQRQPGLDYGMQLHASERDGSGKIVECPKEACSCWFARESWSTTSGANLYHFLFCFVLFCFIFVCFCFHEIRGPSIGRSSICMMYQQPHVVSSQLSVCSLFSYILWRCRFFRVS